MDRFDEIANSITDEMYAGDTNEEPTPEETTEENVTIENVEKDAVNTAVAATDMAVQKQEELNNLSALLTQEKEKNAQLEALIAQKNAEDENKMVEEIAREAPISPPILDIDPFDDEETVAQKRQKFAEDYDTYMRSKFNKEFEPMLEFSKQAMAQKEHADAIAIVRNIEEISAIGDFDNYIPKIESMLKNNKSLSTSAPLEERIVNAYLIAKGCEALNAKEPSVAEIFEKYKDNAEFAELFNKLQIEKVKGAAKDVPLFSSSSGASGASPNVKRRPANFDEALEKIKGSF